MHEMFNISAKYPGVSSISIPAHARVYDQLVTGLNDNFKLPRYIIIPLDKDILDCISHNNFGVNILLEEVLDWLARNIDRAIDLRKEDMRGKRIGSIVSSGEPRIIWVVMVTSPFIKKADKGYIFTQTRKFNDLLLDIMLKYKHAHYMKIVFPTDKDLFDRQGNLSSIGKITFWREVNKQIKAFEKCETDLRPDSGRADRSKLPMPPLRK